MAISFPDFKTRLQARFGAPGTRTTPIDRHPDAYWAEIKAILEDGVVNGLFDVKHPDYGAVGDGATDDASRIQAAIDAAETAGGGIIYLPPGTYMAGTRLVIGDGAFGPHSGIWLVGAGRNTSVIKMASGANLTELIHIGVTDASTDETQFCGLLDLTIDGNKANQSTTTATVKLWNARYYAISRCSIENSAGHGIYEDSHLGSGGSGWFSARGSITDTRIAGCARDFYGLLAVSPKNSIYSRLHIENNAGGGALFQAGSSSREGTQCVLGDLSITDNAGVGLVLDGTQRFQISNATLNINAGGMWSFRDTLGAGTNLGNYSNILGRNNGFLADTTGTSSAGTNNGTTLTDTTATFLTDGRLVGDVLINTGQSTTTRITGVTETVLTTTTASPEHQASDAYTVTRRYPGISSLTTGDWGGGVINNLHMQNGTPQADVVHFYVQGSGGHSAILSNAHFSLCSGKVIHIDAAANVHLKTIRLNGCGDVTSTAAHGIQLTDVDHCHLDDINVQGTFYTSGTGAFQIYVESVTADLKMSNLALHATGGAGQEITIVVAADLVETRITNLNVRDNSAYLPQVSVSGTGQTITPPAEAYNGSLDITAVAGSEVETITIMPQGFRLFLTFVAANCTLKHGTGNLFFRSAGDLVGSSVGGVVVYSDGTVWNGPQ